MRVLCGVAIGCPDLHFAADALRVPHNPLEDNVVFGKN
jgi:hypothetical protein